MNSIDQSSEPILDLKNKLRAPSSIRGKLNLIAKQNVQKIRGFKKLTRDGHRFKYLTIKGFENYFNKHEAKLLYNSEDYQDQLLLDIKFGNPESKEISVNNLKSYPGTFSELICEIDGVVQVARKSKSRKSSKPDKKKPKFKKIKKKYGKRMKRGKGGGIPLTITFVQGGAPSLGKRS